MDRSECGDEALYMTCFACIIMSLPAAVVTLMMVETIGKPYFFADYSPKPITLVNFTPGPDNGVNTNHSFPPTCESAPPSGMHKCILVI